MRRLACPVNPIPYRKQLSNRFFIKNFIRTRPQPDNTVLATSFTNKNQAAYT